MYRAAVEILDETAVVGTEEGIMAEEVTIVEIIPLTGIQIKYKQ